MHKLLFIILLIFSYPANADLSEEPQMSLPSAHQFSFTDIEGNAIDLSSHKGKPILVVNTASHCGFTPQYAGLQELHNKYHDKGLLVIGVPSADFGGQEFDTEEEVGEFTEKEYEISFPLTSISKVKGSNAHPFYKWAGEQAGILGRPKWNFHKYLIGADGNLAGSYGSNKSPNDPKIIKAIEDELSQ